MRRVAPRIEIVLDTKLKRPDGRRIACEGSRERQHQFRDGGLHIVIVAHDPASPYQPRSCSRLVSAPPPVRLPYATTPPQRLERRNTPETRQPITPSRAGGLKGKRQRRL